VHIGVAFNVGPFLKERNCPLVRSFQSPTETVALSFQVEADRDAIASGIFLWQGEPLVRVGALVCLTISLTGSYVAPIEGYRSSSGLYSFATTASRRSVE
jgi:hypothetical protein